MNVLEWVHSKGSEFDAMAAIVVTVLRSRPGLCLPQRTVTLVYSNGQNRTFRFLFSVC